MSWGRIDRGGVRALLLVFACLLAGLAGAEAFAAPTAAPAGDAAGVVARVNGKPILRRDFDMAVQMTFRQRGRGERSHEDLQTARGAVLESLIDNELLYQKAVQAKTAVPEAEVRQEVDRLKESLGTPEDLAAFFEENGVTEKDFFDQVRRTEVVRRFVDRQLGSPPVPGDAEARAYYDSHPDQFLRPEAVHISQIVVHAPPDARPGARSEARSKAEAILAELKSGKDFARLARLYSDGSEARRGGDSGWVWAGGGALPSVERAALALQSGQTSDIVESRRGFHIIKAVARGPAGATPFEEVRELIIERLTAERHQDGLRAYVADLRQAARIERSP